MPALRPASEWATIHWENTPAPVTLASLKGRVVLVVAFQMRCPGCVSHGLPQAQRARAAFPASDLAVIGLHTVFEHADAQGSPAALHAFLHEYRIRFPVGIDAPSADGGLPRTMSAYVMQGTPTTLLIDRAGLLRLNRFGHLDDMALGAAIATLIGERALAASNSGASDAPRCDANGCPASGQKSE